MDPPSMIRSFKYNSSDNPLPLSFTSCTQNGSNLDISYLKPQVQKSGGNGNVQPPVPAIDDTEISIFDAQKYFSDSGYSKRPQLESPHDTLSVPRLSSASSVDGYGGRNFRGRSFHATPTASSEASWNSQTGLLANPPGSAGVSMRNYSPDDRKKRSQGAKTWIFGHKCCCTGRKSVQVKEGSSDSEHGGTGGLNGSLSSNNNVNGRTNHAYAYGTTPSSTRSSITTENNREIHHHSKAINGTNTVRLLPQIPDFSPGEAPRQQRVLASGLAGGFSFPVLDRSGGAANPSAKGMLQTKTIMHSLDDYPPRDSLEVFQPSGSRPPSMDIPGNGIHRLNTGSPIKRVMNTDDDVGSDASSDLFEIESFSTQTTSYPMYRGRDSFEEPPNFNARRFNNGVSLNNTSNNNSNNNIQYGRRSLDEPPTPSVAATECYPPSEVSIDWSVTTAEGFDRASISNFSISASEIGGEAFFRRQLQEEMGGVGGKRRANGGGGGGGGLLLMGCRQEKAVSVGPQPVKFLPAEGPPMFPMHVGGRPPRADKPPPLGGSHSARVSLAFAA